MTKKNYTGLVIRYAITDGVRLGADFVARRDGLLRDAVRWVDEGVEYVQLREKDLDVAALMEIAAAMMAIFRGHGGGTKLLVNGRADVACAVGADGVHLTSAKDEMTVAQVKALMGASVVSVSCHSVDDVAKANGADLILFGPVIEKRVGGKVVVEGTGMEALREACRAADGVPVLALGGVGAGDVAECLRMGAAGVAGIRMFAR
ncbi:MAG: thiamine phosphate synthase [Bryocella sp.]